MNVFEKQMEEIPNEYRSLPFWSWNDKLDQEELKIGRASCRERV